MVLPMKSPDQKLLPLPTMFVDICLGVLHVAPLSELSDS
jgi:hypothetical protein